MTVNTQYSLTSTFTYHFCKLHLFATIFVTAVTVVDQEALYSLNLILASIIQDDRM